MEEERLDKLLIQRKLVSTRVRAEKVIRETGVLVNGKLVTKTGKRFRVDSDIKMITEDIPWLSKRAFKLTGALSAWDLEIKSATLIDTEARLGAFTEVLIKEEAKKVYAINSKTNQLDSNLESNIGVVNIENTHLRELTPSIINEKCDGCTIDVSSNSLENIFPFLQGFIRDNGFVIALIKPQCEVAKKELGKGGVLKDKKLYRSVIEDVKKYAKLNNLQYVDHIESPILNENGNREFLMLLSRAVR
jgi:23S rRNA (cytidine1920-2'-O)/16S rRNA (cytidine1409-2'-O)-methyltransferase